MVAIDGSIWRWIATEEIGDNEFTSGDLIPTGLVLTLVLYMVASYDPFSFY